MWPFSSDSNAQPASPPGFNFEADARKFELSFQMETMANLMNSVRFFKTPIPLQTAPS
jgi:hypothetical protein